MLEPVIRPAPLRAVEAAARGLGRLGLTLPPLDPDRLEAAARRVDGLTDLGAPDYRPGLEEICAAGLEPHSGLGPFGRLALRTTVTQALATRARLVARQKADDPRLRVPLQPPLLVTGLPRSGTTYLHRMLSLCRDSRPLKTWEIQLPLPPPRGRDRRRETIAARQKLVKRIAPLLDAKHYLDADEPEECFPLLDPSMVSASMWCLFPLYRYLDWYLAQDLTGPYRLYRALLTAFQAETPDRHLILKAPAHAAHLDVIEHVLPEARVIVTHRDPVAVVGSSNSLFYTVHSVVADTVDVDKMGQTCMRLLPELSRRIEAARPALGDRILDVRYRDIVDDPVGTVSRIRAAFGMPFDEADRAAVSAYVAARKQHRHGRHDYALEECGITEAQVRAAFAPFPDRT